MDADAAIAQVDALVVAQAGEHLNNLQAIVLRGVWQGLKYAEIAQAHGYTEGHIKDISSDLWKQLSDALGEKITKSNLKVVVERQAAFRNQSALGSNLPLLAASVSERDFIGREVAIAHLKSLWQQGNRMIVIQGQGGVGKTTLARQFLQQEFGQYLEFPIARESQNITSVESLVEERLHQLKVEVGREFGISLDRLKRKLQATRIGILIDNLEPALDADGKFMAPHRRYVELLRILADPSVQALTLITSRDRLCESAVTVSHYNLPGLEVEAWQQYLQQRPITLVLSHLEAIHQAYGGNAKAMEIIASTIELDFAGDMAIYWQDYANDPLAHSDLANLVTSQFQRLQRLDPLAYRLLCRLGCYRYQEVPTVSTAGLRALLWDVPESKRCRVIESLRNRSLVEHRRGEYWLHPVIRAEAIAQLRASPDLETANRAAAEFWTQDVELVTTVEEALRCFEAYHHYVAIQDYDHAAEVILKRRATKFPAVERLGRTFYKLGLLQPMLDGIQQILDRVTSSYHRSGLYSILGVLYRLLGQMQQAIDCHRQSGAIAAAALECQDYAQLNNPIWLHLKNWEQHALLNLGICQLELWELPAAKAVFDELSTHRRVQLIQEGLAELYNPSVDVFVAFVNSCLDLKQQALEGAQKFEQALLQQTVLGTGHRLLLLGFTYKNLGNLTQAASLFQQAIAYGTDHHYPQVKANALSGLAELHRKQRHFEQALIKHQAAIEILERIGTQYNLAEAYFQLGLTYQSLKDSRAQSCFARAISLFEAMTAPKQVARVQQAIAPCRMLSEVP